MYRMHLVYFAHVWLIGKRRLIGHPRRDRRQPNNWGERGGFQNVADARGSKTTIFDSGHVFYYEHFFRISFSRVCARFAINYACWVSWRVDVVCHMYIPYFDNGLLKKGGGESHLDPKFQRRAIATKLGTKIAETLPNAPIESNFPKKCDFMPKIVFFWKKSQVFKKSLFCLRASISMVKRWPILMFCTPLESCSSPLSNGAHWSRVPPRVQSVGGKMQGGVKKGTPKSRSVGKFLFCVGTKNVSVTKKDQRCLLQFSFCQLGHEKWTDFAQQACLRDQISKFDFFAQFFSTLAKTCSWHSNGLIYVSKLCGFEPFHHFAGCDRNQYVKSEHAHFYTFLTVKKCTWKCKKVKFSLGSRTSSCCLPCVAQRNKIEPWVSQHTHLESLFEISVLQMQSEALQGVWRRRGEKCRRTHFRPQFSVSEFYENWCAARIGRVHQQLCYSLFWYKPCRASCGAKKSKLHEKCCILNNTTYAIVQFGQFYGWYWKPKPSSFQRCITT